MGGTSYALLSTFRFEKFINRNSAELLSKRYNDSLWTTDIAKLIYILIPSQLTDKLGAMMCLQTSNNVLDVIYSEHDAPYTKRVRWRVFWLAADRSWRVELHELKFAVTVWGSHHRNIDSDTVKTDHAIYPASFNWHLTLQLQSNFTKKSNGSFEVVYNNADIVHS